MLYYRPLVVLKEQQCITLLQVCMGQHPSSMPTCDSSLDIACFITIHTMSQHSSLGGFVGMLAHVICRHATHHVGSAEHA